VSETAKCKWCDQPITYKWSKVWVHDAGECVTYIYIQCFDGEHNAEPAEATLALPQVDELWESIMRVYSCEPYVDLDDFRNAIVDTFKLVAKRIAALEGKRA
jgi:hypothetical protein